MSQPFRSWASDLRFRSEHFRDLTEARVLITEWVEKYNHDRPHMALGMRTPAAFAAYCATQVGPSERGE